MLPALEYELRRRAAAKGGFVNCHAHFDSAFELELQSLQREAKELGFRDMFSIGERPLPDKQKLLMLRSDSEFLDSREECMARVIRLLIDEGVTASRTCIRDSTTSAQDVLQTASRLKERFERDILLQFVALPATVEGGLELTQSFRRFAEHEAIGVVGGIVHGGDRKSVEACIRSFFELAAEMSKPLELHVDQAAAPAPNETRSLARVVAGYRAQGYEQRVAAVHCVGLGTQPPRRRGQIIEELVAARVDVVVCPRAGLSMEDANVKSYLHNSMAPLRELRCAGVAVGLGIDNACDLFLPFGDASFLREIELLAEAQRIVRRR